MAQQQPAQSDPVLDAFDRLRVVEIEAEYEDTASSFLAQFQSTAASLEPDGRIKLRIYTPNSMELLKAVLADPQADKICALHWQYRGKEDVNSIIPLLTNNCPELASLCVSFERQSDFDFVSSVLEHPGNKIKVLETPKYPEGDLARFFAALGQSQVLAFTVNGCDYLEFYQVLGKYLAKDLLVRLKVRMDNTQVPLEMMMSLASCTSLAEFEISMGKFLQPTAFAYIPKSITKLAFYDCTFFSDFDWSFLADSSVRELGFYDVKRVDGNQLGDALAVHLEAKGLDKLRFHNCDFVDETLAVVDMELGRVKRLNFEDSNLDDYSVELIADTLQSRSSEMTELTLEYEDFTASSIERYLVPALRHPNCNLNKLSLLACQEHEATRGVEDTFRKRRALFALLQGQQVRRLYCPLRRLPVEMFRLVGEVLL